MNQPPFNSEEVTYDSAALAMLDEVVRCFYNEIVRLAELPDEPVAARHITSHDICIAATAVLASDPSEWMTVVDHEAEYDDEAARFIRETENSPGFQNS